MKLVDILVLGTSAVKRIGSSPIEGKKSSKLYISFYVFFRGKKHRVEVFITGKRFEKSKSSLKKKFSFIFLLKILVTKKILKKKDLDNKFIGFMTPEKLRTFFRHFYAYWCSTYYLLLG